MRFTIAGGLEAAALLKGYPDTSNSTCTEAERPSLVFRQHARLSRRQAARRYAVLASLSLSNASSLARGSTRGGGAGPLGAVGAVLGSVTGFNVLFQRDAGLRKTFNSIDTDGKGHITEKDLEAFANRNGLPGSYAQHFVSAVLSSHSHSNTGAAGRKLREGGAAADDAEQSEDVELTFVLFKNFVRSREDALRRAFNMFDQDGDGRISLGDLDATLSRVAVCCPKTRCIYRCRSHMAERLHSKVAPDNGSLGFSEFRDFFMLLPQQDMLVEYWVAAGAAPELSDKLSVAGRTGDEGGAKGSPWGHLLAGAIAGATSRTATAPLETLRLAAMAGQLQSRSLAQAASDIVSSQGWRGLYRGNLLNVLRSAPQKALDFFAFDAFKRLLGDDTHAKTFLAAGLAGCTSWVALYPLEVVRSRITVAAAAAAAAASAGATASATSVAAVRAGGLAGAGGLGLVDALQTIVRREGAGALYKGLGPSVAAIFPEAAITYGLHDALKKTYTRLAHEEPGVAPSLAFGVLSAFMGQLVSFPLETVSRRLQVAQGVGGAAGMVTVVRGLLAEGGPAALYRGIGAATLRLVPMACVSFGTYELVRAAIVAWEQGQEERSARQLLTQRCVPLVLHGPNGDQEVVGRLCTPAGSTTPTLCATPGSRAAAPGGCGGAAGGLGAGGCGPPVAMAAAMGELVEAVPVSDPAAAAAAAGVVVASSVPLTCGTCPGTTAPTGGAAPPVGVCSVAVPAAVTPAASTAPLAGPTGAGCSGGCSTAAEIASCGASCCKTSAQAAAS
ncbi:hypothetical protein HYH02_006143 [Chlamydomonas schloesseri]|uniref:EF-hand domain-containing protein n=1 Tax=Chlamydomonas schloesseri TaxID=2026947 RepID=A0A836B673_9CHLO|nr:hypothetical protein HYH02_006143 [Chlamydomonas schloesseri]|eukprot:KAG2448792.1 hypothetical protein HYH02_006143 [Chlamydomonas schloesseri]